MRLTFKSHGLMICCLLAALTMSPVRVHADKIFYSIHYDTVTDFKSLEKRVEALRADGFTVFWEKTEFPDLGRFYRIYVGRFSGWDEALAFRDRLKKYQFKEHLGIQWFYDTRNVPPGREAASALNEKSGTFKQRPPSAGDKDRFIDNRDGTVTDTQTGLMWMKNGRPVEFFAAATWSEAIERLINFSYGNHTDWRLPTLEEWSSLIDTDFQDPALVDPNPFINIVTHMPYWTQTEPIYSRYQMYTVMLYQGSIQKQKKSDRAFILLVRAVEKKGG